VAVEHLADATVDRVQLHGTDDAAVLLLDANEHQPLLRKVDAVVDDLRVAQRRLALKDLLRRQRALERPVVDGQLADDGDRVGRDPLPERDLVVEQVLLDQAALEEVEDLQLRASW